MTLYRIYAGRQGIDYHELSKELGFVEAETRELALEYARTLKGFEKPDNGYDEDFIKQGRPPAATEGYVQVVNVFVATPESIRELSEAAKIRQELLEQKAAIADKLAEIEAQIERLQ